MLSAPAYDSAFTFSWATLSAPGYDIAFRFSWATLSAPAYDSDMLLYSNSDC